MSIGALGVGALVAKSGADDRVDQASRLPLLEHAGRHERIGGSHRLLGP